MTGIDQDTGRTRWIRGFLLLMLIGVLGHLFYWYWPRPRASVPSSKSRVAGLVMADAGPEIRVWIPFPHQNLGSLERHLGKLDSISWALQEVLASEHPFEVPSFGPFRVPPATEMAVAADRTGGSFVAMARVYPVAAWLFRAAGFLASNPWMAGGDLTLGGREIRVEWQGALWIARSKSSEIGSGGGRTDVGRSLLLLRMGSLPGAAPAGLYRLLADDSRIVLSSSLSARPFSPRGIANLRFEDAAMSWTRWERTGEAPVIRSLVALSGRAREQTRLPSLMTAETIGAEPWQLPGEHLLDAIGAKVFSRSLQSWRLRSYDPESLNRGEVLVAGLEAFAWDLEGPDTVSVGYVNVVEATRIALQVGEAIHRVPIFGQDEARKWLAFARLLEHMTGVSAVFVWIAGPDQLEVQFWPRAAD